MQQRSILIVEDDVVLCTAMGSALNQRGYDTRTAHSVSDGIDLAKERLPELLILDINLPDGQGWNMLQVIRDAHPNGDLWVILATSERVTRSQLRAHQVNRFIPKPFDLHRILEAVEEFLPHSMNA